jgi:hypothetical protein
MGVKSDVFERASTLLEQECTSRIARTRHSGMDQLYDLAEKNDMSLKELVEGACGGNDDASRELEIARQDNADLAAEIRSLQSQRASFNEPMPDVEALWTKLWRYPHMRLGAIFAVLGIRMWLCSGMVEFVPLRKATFMHEIHANWEWALLQIVICMALYFIVPRWAVSEFANKGSGSVFMKLCALASGAFMSLAAFSGGTDMRLWKYGATDLASALGWLALTAALTMTNIFPSITDTLANSNGKSFHTLRTWFQ